MFQLYFFARSRFNENRSASHASNEELLNIINKLLSFFQSNIIKLHVLILIITITTLLLTGDLHKSSFDSIKHAIYKRQQSTSKGSKQHVLKDITNVAHLRKFKSKSQSTTFNGSSQTIDKDNSIVGNDLFAGLMYYIDYIVIL